MRYTANKTVILFIFLMFYTKVTYADPEIDSLKKLVKNSSGREKVDNMAALTERLNLHDTWESIIFAQEGVQIARENEYKAGEARLLSELGTAFSIIGDYKQGLDYYRQADTLFNKIGADFEKAKSKFDIGLALYDWGYFDKSLKYYLQALKMLEKIEVKKGQEKAVYNQKADIFKSIGRLHHEIGSYNEAMSYFQRSLKMNEENENLEGCITCYLSIGGVYQQLNKFDKALENRLKALELARKFGARKYIGLSLQSTGETYASLGDYQKAMDYFNKGLEFLLEIDNKRQIVKTYLDIGDAQIENNKNYNAAIKNYKKAMEISGRSSILFLQKESCKKLYKAYEDIGNYQRSLDYYKKLSAVNDSIFNRQKSKQIAELRIDYETDKFKSENQMLKKENRLQNYLLILSIVVFAFIIAFIIALYLRYRANMKMNKLLNENKQQIEDANKELTAQNKTITEQKETVTRLYEELKENEQKLREANAAKDKFFSIIAHDLKNPFNVLSNFSENLKKNFDSMDTEKRRYYIDEMNKSVKSLLKLTENLLEWSRAQTGRLKFEPTEFDFYEIAFNNVYLMKKNAEAKNISLSTDIKPETYVYADYNMAMTVVRNLVSNAVKFTDENGEVRISSQSENGHLKVEISDTGIGIPKENIEKIFRIDENHTTKGTAKEEGTGLGLIVCKEFIERNGGSISVESEPEKGSTFKFTLPISRI